MQTIVVNTYPSRNSGGAMIVRQFVNYIQSTSLPYKFIIFTHSDLQLKVTTDNIQLVNVKINPILSSLSYWQLFGVKKWLKRNKIFPICLISLSNTNIVYDSDSVLNINYFHQPLPLYKEYSWNVLKSEERILWLYKSIYRILIKYGLKQDSETFVQLQCIKDRFCKVFNRPNNRVHIIRPDFTPPEKSNKTDLFIDSRNINLIYPATYFKYKNHQILFSAIRLLKKEGIENVRLFLTVEENIIQNIEDIRDKVVCLGSIEYATLIGYYSQCDALVFPSYIESFGLPLLESASLGKQIIAANTDFAKEMLAGYNAVAFCESNIPEMWAKEIRNIKIHKRNDTEPLNCHKNGEGWLELFRFIQKNIN